MIQIVFQMNYVTIFREIFNIFNLITFIPNMQILYCYDQNLKKYKNIDTLNLNEVLI